MRCRISTNLKAAALAMLSSFDRTNSDRATNCSMASSMLLRSVSNSVSSATCSLTGTPSVVRVGKSSLSKVSESMTSLSVSGSASLTLSSGSSILENYLARTNPTLSYHKEAATTTPPYVVIILPVLFYVEMNSVTRILWPVRPNPAMTPKGNTCTIKRFASLVYIFVAGKHPL